MTKKYSILLTGLMASIALGTLVLLLTGPSWSSPATLQVSSAAPEILPPPGGEITLTGSGFSSSTNLWLVPERSLRTATTATLETFGNPHHIICRNDRLYVANGVGGFFVVQNLQSPAPQISGILNSEGQGMEIVLRRDTALMASGIGGLQIIDIRDDANPHLLSTLKSAAPALSVAASGRYAYVATGKSGVKIVDLDDPRHPRSTEPLAGIAEAYKVFCDGEYLLIATASGGWIYDIRQPEKPQRLAPLPVAGGFNSCMIRQGKTVYWAEGGLPVNRLHAIDISQPSAPQLLSSLPLRSTPMGISASDNQIAVALGSRGTQFFSLMSNQLQPGPAISAKSRTHHALLLGSELWIADGSGQLLRLDRIKASALTPPVILPDYKPQLDPIVTAQLFILGNRDSISIYDRWNERSPVLLARLPVTGLTQLYLSADQSQLWLATRTSNSENRPGKLVKVDISTLHLPKITDEIQFQHAPIIIGEQGRKIVITSQTSEQSLFSNKADRLSSLHLIDMLQPVGPESVTSYPLATAVAGVGITDEVILIMHRDGLLRVVDLRETNAPKELGKLQMPWLHAAAWTGRIEIAVKGNMAFISSTLGKIFFLDLQDLRRPVNLGGFTLAGPVVSLQLSDHFLLAEIKSEGVVVIDLSNERGPEFLGTVPLSGMIDSLTVQGERLWYTNTSASGIFSIPLPRRLQSTLTGNDQLVARHTEETPPGPYRLWLKDKQGHLLVPGISWSLP